MGNLVTGKEDTLFGLPTQRGKDISRDTVCTAELFHHPDNSLTLTDVAWQHSKARDTALLELSGTKRLRLPFAPNGVRGSRQIGSGLLGMLSVGHAITG